MASIREPARSRLRNYITAVDQLRVIDAPMLITDRMRVYRHTMVRHLSGVTLSPSSELTQIMLERGKRHTLGFATHG